MADNVVLNSGSGGETAATDDVGGVQYQKIKLADGTADSSTMVAAGGGAEAAALRVTLASDSTGLVSVDDNGSSLTVDAPVGAPAFVRLSDGAAAIATLPVSLAAVPSHAVTNAGVFAIQESGDALAALQIIDDWDESDRAKVNPIVGQAGVAAGAGAVGVTVQRVTLASDDPAVVALQVIDNAIAGSEMQVDVVAALPAGTNNIGDVDILTIAAGDNNIGNVDIVTMPNVTLAAGTNTNEVVGDAAHDAAIAGNPVRMAGRALTADYTAVAAGDTADLITTLLGKLVTMPYANPNQSWNYAAPAGGLVSTTAVTIKTAAGAGIRNYVTHIDVVNSHQTTSTELVINDGAGGTALWRGWIQAAGGGYSINFEPPLRGTANTLLEIDEITTTGTAGVVFNANGFVAAE